MKSVFLAAALVLGAPALLIHADPNLGFTAFAGQDLSGLANGQVLQARGGLIEFERGVTAQSLYFMEAPPQTVLQKMQTWNPASHSDLDVWLHQPLPPHPTAADFSALNSLPDNKSVNNMVDATYKYTPGSDLLQLNQAEEQRLAAGHDQPHSKQFIVDTWSQILAGRIADFLSGNIANARYRMSAGEINPVNEVRTLLRSDPKIFAEFHPMLSGTPVYNAHRTTPAQLYYECFDIQSTACFGTGAVYLAQSPATIQRADIEYFVSSGIYTSVEIEQLWPVTLGGKNGTLVWAHRHGLDRERRLPARHRAARLRHADAPGREAGRRRLPVGSQITAGRFG